MNAAFCAATATKSSASDMGIRDFREFSQFLENLKLHWKFGKDQECPVVEGALVFFFFFHFFSEFGTNAALVFWGTLLQYSFLFSATRWVVRWISQDYIMVGQEAKLGQIWDRFDKWPPDHQLHIRATSGWWLCYTYCDERWMKPPLICKQENTKSLI